MCVTGLLSQACASVGIRFAQGGVDWVWSGLWCAERWWCVLGRGLIVRLVLSLRHFVAVASLGTWFDLLSGMGLLTFVGRGSLRLRGVLCVSDCPGWVGSVVVSLIRFLHVYGGVTLPPIYVLCIAHVPCWHLVVKMFSSQHSSALVYSFRCNCGLQYLGRTGQRLDARVKQYVPTKIRLGNYFADHINNTYGSAIAEHLINNRDCVSSFSVDLFTILSRFHSDFHLKVLETIYILTHKPSLCKQRECLLGLNAITI